MKIDELLMPEAVYPYRLGLPADVEAYGVAWWAWATKVTDDDPVSDIDPAIRHQVADHLQQLAGGADFRD